MTQNRARDSAKHLPPLLAEAFHFVQEVQDEFQAGIIDVTSGAQVLDTPELAQALGVKHGLTPVVAGWRAEEPSFLIVDYGLGVDARQLGDEFEGITSAGFLVVIRKILGGEGWVGVHGRRIGGVSGWGAVGKGRCRAV